MLIIDRKQCSSPVSPLLDVQNLFGPRPTSAKPSGQAGGADLGLVCLVWDSIWDRYYQFLLFYHGPKPLWAKTYLGIGKPEVHVRQVTDLHLVCRHPMSDLTTKMSTPGSKHDHRTIANLCEQNLSGQAGGACEANNRSAPSVQTLNMSDLTIIKTSTSGSKYDHHHQLVTHQVSAHYVEICSLLHTHFWL